MSLTRRAGAFAARRAGRVLRRRTVAALARRAAERPPTPVPVALGGLLASAATAVALLRPRAGLLEPDPVRCEEVFEAAEVARARAYRRRQRALGATAGAAQATTLLVLARRPARNATPRPTGRRVPRPLVDAGRGVALTATIGAIGLPFDAIAHRRARRAGLATQSWDAWALDGAKSAAIGLTLTAGASAGVLALMRRSPRHWWVTTAGAGVAGATLLTLLAPVVLDPAFNRFAPLAPGPLRDDVLELARRAGVRVHEVYEVDASRRTTAANAYVTGLGPTKRVVLFDTLLERFTPEEARVVVAHEFAHVRHRDVPRGLAYLALVAPAALRAAAALTTRLRPAEEEPDLATLAALTVALGLVGALVGAASGPVARALETRADVFSLQLTDAPEAFISFERKIVRQNLADPDPPRWLVALGATHPSALRRIGVARAHARLAAAAGPVQSLGSEPG